MTQISMNTQFAQQLMTEVPTSTNNLKPIDEQKWNSYKSAAEKALNGSVTMADLLALFSQIIEASQKLRSEVMKNRIGEAVATSKIATMLAKDKCSDAQLQFGIKLASGAVSMAMTAGASIRIGQTKVLQDKHLSRPTDKGIANTGGVKLLKSTDLESGKVTHLDKSPKVSDLTPQDINKFTANIQQGRTTKYNGVITASQLASNLVDSANSMRDAEQVKGQNEIQAAKELKEKFDGQLDQFVQNLTSEHVKLNEILDALAKASLVTNR
ncbi:type III secretion system protein [Shewanella sp. WE21]|jgi:hypothetical protein|uniref:type III secretion system protein n=1 Tax=Shewanella sp. WE21 TaxID=2029986 RepID=UPI000CF72769|nr:type III secretion system protein [Shewanella sp. WE21]AVI67760.1 type III secretion system protein [Shewanella sp. WE21]